MNTHKCFICRKNTPFYDGFRIACLTLIGYETYENNFIWSDYLHAHTKCFLKYFLIREPYPFYPSYHCSLCKKKIKENEKLFYIPEPSAHCALYHKKCFEKYWIYDLDLWELCHA